MLSSNCPNENCVGIKLLKLFFKMWFVKGFSFISLPTRPLVLPKQARDGRLWYCTCMEIWKIQYLFIQQKVQELLINCTGCISQPQHNLIWKSMWFVGVDGPPCGIFLYLTFLDNRRHVLHEYWKTNCLRLPDNVVPPRSAWQIIISPETDLIVGQIMQGAQRVRNVDSLCEARPFRIEQKGKMSVNRPVTVGQGTGW